MKVRGISILTRKMIITRRFGAEPWALYRDVAASHPTRAGSSPGTLVPCLRISRVSSCVGFR
jgi:hypothetical protein